MGKFAGSLKNLAKTDNSVVAHKAKVTIRRNVLAAIGADRAVVFDAFAGEGNMFREVWAQARSCVGCDIRFIRDDRLAFVGDNVRVLRAIDLAPFTIFDLDAYGCPWEQVYIIARRRTLAPGETIGLVITEGQGLKMKLGGVSRALSLMAGIRLHMVGMSRAQDQVIDRAIGRLAKLMNATVVSRWQAAGLVGSSMRYIGLVLQANPEPAEN